MFRGCRREDMPPHIFATGQQAFRNMMVTHSDQALILTGLSGAGKTFNTRYLLRYLATIGQPAVGPVTREPPPPTPPQGLGGLPRSPTCSSASVCLLPVGL